MGTKASCGCRGLFCEMPVSGRDLDVGAENADFGGVSTLT